MTGRDTYTIKLKNFEGPFDLLFHLIEENKVDLYDIPINVIADQYMEYLFSMQQLDLEVASEFLVMASTLLHIKSRMLLPKKNEIEKEEGVDPREELVIRLLEYKKYKNFSQLLMERELQWSTIYYKLPEAVQFTRSDEVLELSEKHLFSFYSALLKKNKNKINTNASSMEQVIKQEKVTIRSKIREIASVLLKKTFFKFADLYPIKEKSKADVVTAFIAILELAKRKKVRLKQKKQFADIYVYNNLTGKKNKESERGDEFGN